MDFRFKRKELIIISVIILTPMVIFIVSFSVGKFTLSAKISQFRKAGIPTTIQEYNDKYYAPILESENARQTLETAFKLYNKKYRLYMYSEYSPILDQKIDSRLLAIHKKFLEKNKDFNDKIKKLDNYINVRYKCKYSKVYWSVNIYDFQEIADYYAIKIEETIKRKEHKKIGKLFKSAFHSNTLSSLLPYTNYYYREFQDCDFTVLRKFVRCLSVVEFLQKDLQDFIKIFNKHESIMNKDIRKNHSASLVYCFELTNLKNLKKYFARSSDFSKGPILGMGLFLYPISYYSGLNSYEVLDALRIIAEQQKLSSQAYCKIQPQLKKLDDESLSRFYPFVAIAKSVSINNNITGTYSAIARLRCAKTACAVELFRSKYKKLPGSLKQLVPEFLPKIPIDPFNGKELKYKHGDFEVMYPIPEFDKSGQIIYEPQKMLTKKFGYYIYSVGENLIDDNGDLLNFNNYYYSFKDITVPVSIKRDSLLDYIDKCDSVRCTLE